MEANTNTYGRGDSAARKNLKVTVRPEAIRSFRKSWPCSGLPTDDTLQIEFGRDGNLINLAWQSGCDHWEAETSGALLALVNECSPNRSL